MVLLTCAAGVLGYTVYVLSGPARTDHQRRFKLKFDNMFTAQTRAEVRRSLITPAERYEASAATRAFLARERGR